MTKQKINLNNIKVAIFDFDDTLAIHKDKKYLEHRNESDATLIDYYLKAYLNPSSFYETIEPCSVSETILKLINILRKNKTRMYCLTGSKFSFPLKAKEYFVRKHYGSDIEMLLTRDQSKKVDATKIISKINNCKLDEILFIDDLKDNISKLNVVGINALLPSEVEGYIKLK